jgi:hypothetical protein
MMVKLFGMAEFEVIALAASTYTANFLVMCLPTALGNDGQAFQNG